MNENVLKLWFDPKCNEGYNSNLINVLLTKYVELVCDAAGSPRRCGGQGDILSGSMGTFLHWARTNETRASKPSDRLVVNYLLHSSLLPSTSILIP